VDGYNYFQAMKKLILFLTTICLSLSCNNKEDELGNNITKYLKNNGVLVEELQVLSVDTMNKAQYENRMVREILRDGPDLKIIMNFPDTQIQDNMTGKVDEAFDRYDKVQKAIAVFKDRIRPIKECSDFGFYVTTFCKSQKLGGKTLTSQLGFLVLNNEKMEILVDGGEKYLRKL
jgi:hypothetical protein